MTSTPTTPTNDLEDSMQSSAFETGKPWADAELIKTLTTPDLARQLWRTRSTTADVLRTQFGNDECGFLAYVAAIVERSTECAVGQKPDWRAYTEQARMIPK
jgi:hypothetical protein